MTPEHDTTIDSKHIYINYWNSSSFPLFGIDIHTARITDVNPAMETLCDLSHQELVNSSFLDLLPENEQTLFRKKLPDISVPGVLNGFHLQKKELIPVEISFATRINTQNSQLCICSIRDLKTLTATEHELWIRNWELAAYAAAAMALSKATTADQLMQLVCEALTHESRYVLAWVGIAEQTEAYPIRVAAAAGSGKQYVDDIRISWSADDPNGQGPTGVAIRTGKVQIMSDRQKNSAFSPWNTKAKKAGIRASVTIPFSYNRTQRGALMVYSETSFFSRKTVELFERLALEIGHGLTALIEREELEKERWHRESAQLQITEALTATIRAMAKTMESRDPYTAGHQDRVSIISCEIAKHMQWPAERILGLQMAALVHDIGKIAVPIEILTKPSRLSQAEFSLIKEHPSTGYSILKDIPFPWPVAEIVHQHHEKIDGSGYPFGLSGDQILTEAKILAVADIVEAMASYRPYRPALGIEIAIQEILRQSGRQLDADIVNICVNMLTQGNFSFPQPNHAQ